MTGTRTAAPGARRLAEFASGLDAGALPDAVVHSARRSLLDWLAAALAGTREPAARKLRRALGTLTSDKVAGVIGDAGRTSVSFAALANGHASHLQDYDDIFNPPQTTVHLGSCLWPAILAAAELRPMSGADAVASLVAGFETGARVGCAAGTGHYESAWQATGTVGRLAAAAAVARGLRLSPAQAANALGIAAGQASGLRENYGSDTKGLAPGRAAMDGIIACQFAAEGFTARDTAIDGDRGLFAAVSPDPDPAQLSAGLGATWRILENGHKLYPCASVIHPVIDAALAAARGETVREAEVVEVRATMYPFAVAVSGVVHPGPGAEARFSAAHCVAAALLRKGVGTGEFGVDSVADPALRALREKVRLIAEPGRGKRGATIEVALRDGRVLHATVGENRGTPGNPLSDAELAAKFTGVASAHAGERTASRLVDACWALESAGDIRVISEPLCVPPGAPVAAGGEMEVFRERGAQARSGSEA